MLVKNIRNKFLNIDKIFEDEKLYKELSKLTLSKNSLMKLRLRDLKKICENSNYHKPEVKVSIAYNLQNKIIGWCMIDERENEGIPLHIFVKESYRRKGVGSYLIKTAYKNIKKQKIMVFSWDKQSTNFYKNFQNYKRIINVA